MQSAGTLRVGGWACSCLSPLRHILLELQQPSPLPAAASFLTSPLAAASPWAPFPGAERHYPVLTRRRRTFHSTRLPAKLPMHHPPAQAPQPYREVGGGGGSRFPFPEETPHTPHPPWTPCLLSVPSPHSPALSVLLCPTREGLPTAWGDLCAAPRSSLAWAG